MMNSIWTPLLVANFSVWLGVWFAAFEGDWLWTAIAGVFMLLGVGMALLKRRSDGWMDDDEFFEGIPQDEVERMKQEMIRRSE